MRACNRLVGLDGHKSTIAVAIAERDRMPPASCGLTENTPEAITQLIKRLDKEVLRALLPRGGPCGHLVCTGKSTWAQAHLRRLEEARASGRAVIGVRAWPARVGP